MGQIIDWFFSPPPHACIETDSFVNKCKWLFTCLDKTVLITEGRNILDDWRYSCDGRAVISLIVTHGHTSTAAQLRANLLMNSLVNEKLTKDWNRPILDYISWFLRTATQYNTMALTDAQRLTPAMLRAMLERNVEAAKPLADVAAKERFDLAKGGVPLTIDQYFGLLKSQAAEMDKSRIYRSRQRYDSNVHDSQPYDGDEEAGAPDEHTDSTLSIEAYAATQRTPGASMNKETWTSLTRKSQEIWDSLDPSEKAKILNYAHSRAEARQANLSDVAPEPAADTSPADDAPDAAEDEPAGELEASVARGSNAHPGDIRRMMGRQPARPRRAANHVRWAANTLRRVPMMKQSTVVDGPPRDLLDDPPGADLLSASPDLPPPPTSSGGRGDAALVPPSQLESSDAPSHHFSSPDPFVDPFDELALWGSSDATPSSDLDRWGAQAPPDQGHGPPTDALYEDPFSHNPWVDENDSDFR